MEAIRASYGLAKFGALYGKETGRDSRLDARAQSTIATHEKPYGPSSQHRAYWLRGVLGTAWRYMAGHDTQARMAQDVYYLGAGSTDPPPDSARKYG